MRVAIGSGESLHARLIAGKPAPTGAQLPLSGEPSAPSEFVGAASAALVCAKALPMPRLQLYRASD
ncbi:MAG TPA: hypothetical protein PLJ65_03335 [Casimicrobium sp.]|nr:hypothetical protein [Casimicrobium sp.]